MGEVLKKFGRYFLLDHIAQGGMAEIYRARLASADGAGRLLVIKRMQSGFGANSEFLQMFKSEIKVTMGFNHPNIVQLYDFGEEQSQPYIAMEFVDGRNLRQFLSRFNELKQSFPVDLAAYVIEQSASGLHYAHAFKDKITGQPLNIVHRDISPQNILISYEGNVKVIDFGIAKAASNSEATRAGVIKGKPSYLSPEQITGDPLDGRCDIFALGIVLWELLTGKKLFAGENDLAVLKLIESVNTHLKPPSTLNPKVPKELDYIVLKTLARQREKRYQTAEELQRALHKFLYSFNPDFNPGDLAYYAKDLFKNEIVEDRKRIQKLNEKAEQLLSTDIPDAPPTADDAPEAPKREDTTTVVNAKGAATREGGSKTFDAGQAKNVKIEIDTSPVKIAQAQQQQQQRPTLAASRTVGSASGMSTRTQGSGPSPAPVPQQRIQKKSSGMSALAKPALAAAAGLVGVTLFGPELGIRIPVLSDLAADLMGSGVEAHIVLQGRAQGVQVAVNGQQVANALPATLKGIPVGSPVRITVTGPGGGFQQDVTLRKGEKRQIQVVLTEQGLTSANGSGGGANTAAAAKTMPLRFVVSPPGAGTTITLNGQPVDPENPVAIVPLDAPLEVVIERPDFKPYRNEFTLSSRQPAAIKDVMTVQLEPNHYGFVSIRSTPTADTVLVNGQKWYRGTPIENEKFPVGNYTIRLVNEVLGMEKTVSLSVQEGKIVDLAERLEVRN